METDMNRAREGAVDFLAEGDLMPVFHELMAACLYWRPMFPLTFMTYALDEMNRQRNARMRLDILGERMHHLLDRSNSEGGQSPLDINLMSASATLMNNESPGKRALARINLGRETAPANVRSWHKAGQAAEARARTAYVPQGGRTVGRIESPVRTVQTATDPRNMRNGDGLQSRPPFSVGRNSEALPGVRSGRRAAFEDDDDDEEGGAFEVHDMYPAGSAPEARGESRGPARSNVVGGKPPVTGTRAGAAGGSEANTTAAASTDPRGAAVGKRPLTAEMARSLSREFTPPSDRVHEGLGDEVRARSRGTTPKGAGAATAPLTGTRRRDAPSPSMVGDENEDDRELADARRTDRRRGDSSPRDIKSTQPTGGRGSVRNGNATDTAPATKPAAATTATPTSLSDPPPARARVSPVPGQQPPSSTAKAAAAAPADPRTQAMDAAGKDAASKDPRPKSVGFAQNAEQYEFQKNSEFNRSAGVAVATRGGNAGSPAAATGSPRSRGNESPRTRTGVSIAGETEASRQARTTNSRGGTWRLTTPQSDAAVEKGLGDEEFYRPNSRPVGTASTAGGYDLGDEDDEEDDDDPLLRAPRLSGTPAAAAASQGGSLPQFGAGLGALDVSPTAGAAGGARFSVHDWHDADPVTEQAREDVDDEDAFSPKRARGGRRNIIR